MPLTEGETTCNEAIIDPDETIIGWSKKIMASKVLTQQLK